MLTNAPKGTKDILPDQVHKWHHVEHAFSQICAKYGFREIRTPVFEHTELFVRGVGDTTDIVQKEMYTFQDYAKRNITLRPEGTASVVRSFVEHKLYADVQPSKYWYNIDCFRYEKPQSGRQRAFHQFGIEIFGTNSMIADAEVISLGYDFLTDMGLADMELRINSIGCPKCRASHRKALREFLFPKYDELCDTCKDRYERNPLRIMDCKSPICQELIHQAPLMIDFLCEECEQAFEEIQRELTAMGLQYTVDSSIVRGLDYYTKTAFEFVTTSEGIQGTVCGGGRYDHLIEELGGPPIPGVGFGLGIERLILNMEANGYVFPEVETPEVFIAVIGEKAKFYGLKLVRDLRAAGIKTEVDSLERNIKGQFKYANRLGAKKTIVIGDDEIAEKKLAIKDMATSEQKTVDMDAILDELTK